MTEQRLNTDLLLEAGRMLLEFNESTAAIHRSVTATAAALTVDPCQVTVFYGGVAVSLAGDRLALAAVDELRYNTAVQARVHQILGETRAGRLGPAEALARLRSVEANTPRYPRWLACAALGIAAAALARLLGADGGAAAVAGTATGVGLFVRQELGRRKFGLLANPFAAAFIGAAAGGLAIRLGWTGTPDLVLVVPALMVVPGPHLINGLLDLIDNFLPMSLARLGLAAGVLVAGAAGVALGVELTLPDPVPADPSAAADGLTLLTDAALAGIVTCGFAVFYNTDRRHLGLAALPGMTGHGLRFLALEAGFGLLAATFLGGLAVGVSALIAHRHRTPVAVIAFAGAVTMIPGLALYRAFGGALRLARLSDGTDPGAVTATLSNALQAGLVIGGLALGLVLGARAVLALAGDRDSPMASRVGSSDANHQEDRVCLAPDDEPVRVVKGRSAGGNER